MPRPERSPERRELDWQALIETALTAPGNIGNTYNRFYRYSFLNQLLLLMQGVQEPVATYKRWQAIGRQVLKGSKAAEIVRPITITKKNDDGEIEATFTRFKPVRCLFTYSQTEGEKLPPAVIPEWSLPAALENLDIRQVPFRHLDGNIQGYSVNRDIAINPVATDPTSTTFHELGHIVLGHTSEGRRSEYIGHRGTFEFQAEATAYLSMNELDQLSEERASESRAYIQGWLRTERPSDVAIRQVFSDGSNLDSRPVFDEGAKFSAIKASMSGEDRAARARKAYEKQTTDSVRKNTEEAQYWQRQRAAQASSQLGILRQQHSATLRHLDEQGFPGVQMVVTRRWLWDRTEPGWHLYKDYYERTPDFPSSQTHDYYLLARGVYLDHYHTTTWGKGANDYNILTVDKLPVSTYNNILKALEELGRG